MAVLSVGVVNVLGVQWELSGMIDLQRNLASHELSVDEVGFSELLGRPQIKPRVGVLPYKSLNLGVIEVHDPLHLIAGDFHHQWITFKSTERDGVLENLWSILANDHLELVGVQAYFLDLAFLWVLGSS